MRDHRQETCTTETCATETLDQRDIRLEIDRESHQQTRIVESPDQTTSHFGGVYMQHICFEAFLDSLCPLSLMSADGATVTSLTPLSCSPICEQHGSWPCSVATSGMHVIQLCEFTYTHTMIILLVSIPSHHCRV